MRAVVIVFVEVGWRRGLGAMKPRSGTGKQRKGPGGRRRRKCGSGRWARCMWWPRRALFGCAALKSAHPSSRQTVPRRCLRKGQKSGLVLVFLDRIAVDMSKERARGAALNANSKKKSKSTSNPNFDMRHRPNESAHTQVQTGIRLLSLCSSRIEH